MERMYYLGFAIIVVGVSVLLLHGIIKISASRIKQETNILHELEKKILELNLKTKVFSHNHKCSPIYDISGDIIELENKNTFPLFCSAFHELGHAYFNKYCSIARYTKEGILIKKEQSEKLHPYFYTITVILISVSSIAMFWWKALSIILSILAILLFTSVLREEFMASITAMNVIKASKYLNKKQTFIGGLYLISLLGTYMYLFFIPVMLIIYNIL